MESEIMDTRLIEKVKTFRKDYGFFQDGLGLLSTIQELNEERGNGNNGNGYQQQRTYGQPAQYSEEELEIQRLRQENLRLRRQQQKENETEDYSVARKKMGEQPDNARGQSRTRRF